MTHVALTDEQAMLATTTARMVADQSRPGAALAEYGRTNAELWAALVANGLIGLAVPEKYGGAGGTTFDVALVVEQLARGLTVAPYLGTVLALDLLVTGTPEGADTAALLSGRPGCVVLEPTLTRLSISGIAIDVAPNALAVGVDGDALCILELGERLDSADLSRPMARAGEASHRCGYPSSEASQRWQALALALVCADLVGTTAATLEAAVAHARTRHQFGRPVGSFQAVQQLCADQLVNVESCRSITWRASWAVDALEPAEALAVARVAKAYCSEVGRTVCEAAIQVWGGMGMTWDCAAHRYLRRALLDRQLFGDERVHLGSIAANRLTHESQESC
jgi:alkylation response protein AidB-like acyl-CoA dehydrogenase